MLDWFTTTETKTATEELKSEIGGGGDFFQIISAKLKNESSFRKEIKQTYERKVSELARKADEIAGYIQKATKKEVLVVIDDLDKLDLALVEYIYRDNINSLFLPNFRIIFTIPISAIRNSELVAVLQSVAPRPQLMGVAKFYARDERHKPDAKLQEKSVEMFLEVLSKRIPAHLLESETARKIVLQSGGVIRELVRIARECCAECLLSIRSEPDRQDIRINAEILEIAIRNLRNDFSRTLGLNRYSILVETYRNGKPPNAESEEFLSLLHGLYVLEYLNDSLWYDTHPIVTDLLKREGLI